MISKSLEVIRTKNASETLESLYQKVQKILDKKVHTVGGGGGWRAPDFKLGQN